MLAVTGQTAGPNGMTFFKGTHGYPKGNIGKKNNFFSKINFFIKN